MKKLLSITIILLMAIAVSAQERYIDRNATFNGKAFAISKSAIASPDNAFVCEDGDMWYLENKRIGDDNYIRFWIQKSNGMKTEYQSWHHNMAGIVMFHDNGRKGYKVLDDTFRYLIMLETDFGYIIKIFTEELQ